MVTIKKEHDAGSRFAGWPPFDKPPGPAVVHVRGHRFVDTNPDAGPRVVHVWRCSICGYERYPYPGDDGEHCPAPSKKG